MTVLKSEQQITSHLTVAIDEHNRVVAVVDGDIIASCRHALLVTTGEAQDMIQKAETTDAAIAAVTLPDGESPNIPISEEWTVENELMVHASNLEAWVENDYDPRLIHSNIARPIIECLARVDERAKNRLLATLEELIGKGTETLVTWAVEKYHDFLLDMVDSNVVLAAILNNVDQIFKDDRLLRKKYSGFISKADFMRLMISKHFAQLEEIWCSLKSRIRKRLITEMGFSEIKVMFLTKSFDDIDLVDLTTIHAKITTYVKGLSFVEKRDLVLECQALLKSIKAFLSVKIMHLDRMNRYRLSLQFGKNHVENICDQKPDAFSLWDFAFKVVNAAEPGHVNKNTAFHVVSMDALQRIKFKLRKTTIQNDKEFGPFSCFTDLEHAWDFIDRENGNCILLCLVKRTSARTLWKKNPPDFARNTFGGGYHAVSNGRSEQDFDRLPEGVILCSKVIPIRAVAFKGKNGVIDFHGRSKQFTTQTEVKGKP